MLVFGIILIFKKQLFLLDKREGGYAFGISSLFGLSSIFYFMASKYIGTGLSMVIFFTFPTMVAVLSWFFNGHRGTVLYFFASLFLTGLGIFLLTDKGHLTINTYGFGLSALSALSYAFYMIIGKKEIRKLSPMLSSFAVTLGCMFFFFLASFGSHSFCIPESFILWVYILGISIIATVLPLYLMLLSLEYITSTEVSILSALSPIVTVIVGISFLNESLNWIQAIGILTVLGGSVIIQFDKSLVDKQCNNMK